VAQDALRSTIPHATLCLTIVFCSFCVFL